MRRVTIAVAKGRIAQDVARLWEKAGIPCPAFEESRRLIMSAGNFDYILVKPADVPVYVEHGIADLGVVGRDTLLEEERDLYELVDLGVGRCRFAVAGLPGKPARSQLPYLTVATKYPNVAKRYFQSQGTQIEIIKLNGSVELAPLLGLADRIVDIVETGRTLQENGLSIMEEICPISTQLVANRVSLKMQQPVIRPLLEMIAAAVEGSS